MMIAKHQPVIMEEITDPSEILKAHAQQERFQRNSAWLQSHIAEVYSHYRGQCICVAGQELFAADAPEQALALANAAHPEDDGRLLRYVPKESMARIHANQRALAALR